MSFLRDTVKSAGAGLVMTVTRFFAMAIIARKLGVEGFCVLSFSVFCLDLIALFALAGLPGLTSRFSSLASMSERPGFQRFVSLWLAGSIGIVLVSAPVVAAYVIGLEDWLLYLFCCWSILVVLQTAVTAQMQGAMRFDLLAWGNSAGAAVLILGAIFFIGADDPAGAFAVLAATALTQALPVLLLWSGLARPAPPRDASDGLPPRRSIVVYGLNAWVTALTTALVWGRGEVLVIESMLSPKALGYYGAAMTLLAMVWRMTQMLQGAVAPHLSNRIKSGGAELETFVTSINRLTLAISAGSALLLALCGRELAILVFGEEFRRTGEILAWLAPGAATAGIGTVNLAVQYLSNGRFTRNAVMLAALGLLGGSVLLIDGYGLYGAATMRAAVLIAMSIAMTLWLIDAGYATLGKRVTVEVLATIIVVASASLLSLSTELPFLARGMLWFVMTYLIFGRATGSFVPTRMIRGGVRLLRAL